MHFKFKNYDYLLIYLDIIDCDLQRLGNVVFYLGFTIYLFKLKFRLKSSFFFIVMY